MSASRMTLNEGRAYFLASLEYGTHPALRLLSHIGNVDRCRAGHDRTPENTYIQPSTGQHICRTCKLGEPR